MTILKESQIPFW